MADRPWTPGPWEWDRRNQLQRVPENGGSFGELIVAPDDFPHIKVSDAALIALAPEMAEAIFRASSAFECYCDRSGECAVCELDAVAERLRRVEP
jgi:hypothetical protein